MSKHPSEPHLFVVRVDGELHAAIRANSQAEARDYWLENHVVIERPTPTQAFRIGSLLTADDLENAKPEYAEPADRTQLPIFPQDNVGGETVDAGVAAEGDDHAQP